MCKIKKKKSEKGKKMPKIEVPFYLPLFPH